MDKLVSAGLLNISILYLNQGYILSLERHTPSYDTACRIKQLSLQTMLRHLSNDLSHFNILHQVQMIRSSICFIQIHVSLLDVMGIVQ